MGGTNPTCVLKILFHLQVDNSLRDWGDVGRVSLVFGGSGGVVQSEVCEYPNALVD